MAHDWRGPITLTTVTPPTPPAPTFIAARSAFSLLEPFQAALRLANGNQQLVRQGRVAQAHALDDGQDQQLLRLMRTTGPVHEAQLIDPQPQTKNPNVNHNIGPAPSSRKLRS
jgi:hypothetical protein